jgi:hypothetical protein
MDRGAMHDAFQRRLEVDLKRVFKGYKKLGAEARVAYLEDFRARYLRTPQHKEVCPLVSYVVRGGAVTVDPASLAAFAKEKDDRAAHTLLLIRGALKWCAARGVGCPDTELHVWISDRFPYFMEDLETLPVFVYARPRDVDLPILPDNTFTCTNLHQKYAG